MTQTRAVLESLWKRFILYGPRWRLSSFLTLWYSLNVTDFPRFSEPADRVAARTFDVCFFLGVESRKEDDDECMK